MSMKLAEFNQLKKLMMLTTSENDHEALFALRKANQILAAHGYDWNATFGRLVKVEATGVDFPDDEPEIEEDPNHRRIREALEELEEDNPTGSWARFLESLREQFNERHSLSQKQQQSLFDALDRKRSR